MSNSSKKSDPNTKKLLPQPSPLAFFSRTLPNPANNWLIAAKGPTYQEQLSAILTNNYWTVLNSHYLNNSYIDRDETLCRNVNALKAALQTEGMMPLSHDVTINPRTQNQVCHANVRGASGPTYELEWACVDHNNKILAIVDFQPHENYAFRQKALSEQEKQTILDNPMNKVVLERAKTQQKNLINKENKLQHQHAKKLKLTRAMD